MKPKTDSSNIQYYKPVLFVLCTLLFLLGYSLASWKHYDFKSAYDANKNRLKTIDGFDRYISKAVSNIDKKHEIKLLENSLRLSAVSVEKIKFAMPLKNWRSLAYSVCYVLVLMTSCSGNNGVKDHSSSILLRGLSDAIETSFCYGIKHNSRQFHSCYEIRYAMVTGLWRHLTYTSREARKCIAWSPLIISEMLSEICTLEECDFLKCDFLKSIIHS